MFQGSPVDQPARLVASVNRVFKEWQRVTAGKLEVHLAARPSYMVGARSLSRHAGLLQIRDYAKEDADAGLRDALAAMGDEARATKRDLIALLRSADEMNYFAPDTASAKARFQPRTKFDKVLERRLALAAYLIANGEQDPNLGRTKLAKLIYLSDAVGGGLGLEMRYEAQAAGPLDARAFYNQTVGLEPLAERAGCFSTQDAGKGITRYSAGPNFDQMVSRAPALFGESQLATIQKIVATLAPLDTEQAEIIATLYACWDARLRARQAVTDEELLRDVHAWHEKKRRFQRERLVRAMEWMKEKGLVPTGLGPSVKGRASAA
jgi:hypothetical protein